LATAPGLPFWIADNNSNLATLYSGTGAIQTNAVTGSATVGVTIPTSATGVQANPTGQVYNGTGDLLVPTNKGQEPALFIFDGEGGTIAAWAKDSDASAVTAYDDGKTNGANHAVYKGLAMGTVSGTNYLYATDPHTNKVDVFDTNFAKPASMQGKFVDPTMPSGFAPCCGPWCLETATPISPSPRCSTRPDSPIRRTVFLAPIPLRARSPPLRRRPATNRSAMESSRCHAPRMRGMARSVWRTHFHGIVHQELTAIPNVRGIKRPHRKSCLLNGNLRRPTCRMINRCYRVATR
jgi:hypothetical protein